MSRQTWNLTKQSKQFYVLTYRKAGTALIISVIINLFLCLGIYYIYFGQPDHDFYATNGVTHPDRLIPMDAPNNSSAALLAPDPSDENDNKVMPQ